MKKNIKSFQVILKVGFGHFLTNCVQKIQGPQSQSKNRSKVHTVKSQAVDWSTIQFWNLTAKGHST